MKQVTLITILLTAMGLSSIGFAKDESSLPAIGGYDPVAYHTENKAVRGSGFHVANHKGRMYLFSSKENKAKFEKRPSKYEPAYNGWCAFGVSVNKKFHSDPTVFAIVDGKLYLNLDKKIQKDWNKDRKGSIKKANENWNKIKTKAMASL